MHRRRRHFVAIVVIGLVLAGCAKSSSTHAGSTRSSDFAEASSGGDKRSAAAIREDANFSCPSAATDAGAARPALAAGNQPQVATTVAPITSIVANVAGDRADVHGVIPEGSDSHTYEPKPSVAALFAKADVVFVNGLSLEDPTKELAKNNLPAGGQVIELGSIVLRPDQYVYDFSFPRAGGKPNPHLWTNPPMARCYAVIAASVLSKVDPANASYYSANADRFTAKVDSLDRLFEDASSTMPAHNRELLTYHDAYAYFAAHYRWTIIGAVQVSSFEDPTPKEVARLIEQLKKEKVPAIFGSEVFPSPVLAEIGREAGVRYVDTLRDDDLPGGPGDHDHSYFGLMKADYVTMISSLGGDATALSSFDDSDVVRDAADYPQ
ncbi:MAG: zinc ABC transporter substrate-binding protein [Actinobacteria bacterium]|nr:zinc ABC transporter substrate-binding protein [Actinomycetota bacterium]